MPAVVGAASLIGIVLLWVAIFNEARHDGMMAEREARTDTANLARAFEEHVRRTISGLDQALLYLRHEYEMDPGRFPEHLAHLKRSIFTGLLIQVGVIGADGFLVFSDLASAVSRVDLGDREHFLVHRDRMDDELFISKPVFGRVSKKWSIQFTRRLSTPDGGFGGVLVLSVDPQYFVQFYESIDLGRDGAITLIGMDRVIRARASGTPPAKEPIGMVLPNRPFFDLAQPAIGHYTIPSAVDGIVRIGAFRRLKEYPLVVVVLKSLHEALATFEERRRLMIGGGIMVSLIAGIFAASLGWLTVRQYRIQEQLLEVQHRLATTDPLTGLPNRRHFFDLAGQELARARRYGHALSVLMLDLDHFKVVNDRFGHAAGDCVLKLTADACTRALREIDVVGRVGGEEFAVILPETDQADAIAAAERLRATVAACRPAEACRQECEDDCRLTVSIGVATLRGDEVEFESVLKRADAALYAAKEAGRNQVCADGRCGTVKGR